MLSLQLYMIVKSIKSFIRYNKMAYVGCILTMGKQFLHTHFLNEVA